MKTIRQYRHFHRVQDSMMAETGWQLEFTDSDDSAFIRESSDFSADSQSDIPVGERHHCTFDFTFKGRYN